MFTPCLTAESAGEISYYSSSSRAIRRVQISLIKKTKKAVNVKIERNVLFNDALNTFYLRLYGVRHMVKDHSDSEKGNPLPPHRLLLSISSKGSTYHGLCYTSRGALAGTRNSSMGPLHEGLIRRPIAP